MTFLSSGPKKPSSLQPLDMTGPVFRPTDDESLANRAPLPFHLSILLNQRLDAPKLLQLAALSDKAHDIDLAHRWMLDGKLDETLYFMMVAKRLCVPFVVDLDPQNFQALPLDWSLETLSDLNWAFSKPLAKIEGAGPDPQGQLICAPFGDALDRLAAKLEQNPALKRRICLTTPTCLDALQRALAQERALSEQVYRLKDTLPHLSAHSKFGVKQGFGLVASLVCVIAGSLFWPHFAFFFNLVTIAAFLSMAVLRLIAYLHMQALRTKDGQTLKLLAKTASELERWPSYTVLVPLYREANVVKDLVAALSHLDYPRDRLCINLLVEVDDTETQNALAIVTLPAHFSIVEVPEHGPRTKPKALNYALSFSSSDLVVIYDAEDRPHCGQLKEAALRMVAGDEKLACLQGRLAIDNRSSNFITKQFAIEYSALFDGMLPLLAHERLPVPLGGTSNHFRTKILKEIGGWDPYNVTEDADLGLRLTRLGYNIEILISDTWEEAPECYPAWVKQRTRWFKGWMQTWLVHMRHPSSLCENWVGRALLHFRSSSLAC